MITRARGIAPSMPGELDTDRMPARSILQATQPLRDSVAQRWSRIGGELAVAPSPEPVVVETLIADTARVARDEARLFWIAASWVAEYSDFIGVRRLRATLATLDAEPRAVAGALLAVAALKARAPEAQRLRLVAGAPEPLSPARPLFRVVEATPALAAYLRDESLPVFRAWGLWQDEITWKPEAIRPKHAVLARCPELLLRSLLGPGLEAAILELTLERPAHALELSRQIGATYAATHDAAQSLQSRGLLDAETVGRAEMLSPSRLARQLASLSVA